jgi:hypothetical protein
MPSHNSSLHLREIFLFLSLVAMIAAANILISVLYQVDVYQEEDQSGQIKGGTGGTRAHMAADGSADYER